MQRPDTVNGTVEPVNSVMGRAAAMLAYVSAVGNILLIVSLGLIAYILLQRGGRTLAA